MAIPRPARFPGDEHSFDLNGVFVHRNKRSASNGISVLACDEENASRNRNQVRVEDSDIGGRGIVTFLDLIDECRKQSRHFWGTGVFFRYRNHLGNSVQSCAIISSQGEAKFCAQSFSYESETKRSVKLPCRDTDSPLFSEGASVTIDGWVDLQNERRLWRRLDRRAIAKRCCAD